MRAFVCRSSRARRRGGRSTCYIHARDSQHEGEGQMKRMILIVLAATSVSAFAQAPATDIERALLAAPEALAKDATVIKWKADNTYDTLKKGANSLVCYDQSGAPAQQPYSIECTSINNLQRKAQNRKFEAIEDRAARNAAIAA